MLRILTFCLAGLLACAAPALAQVVQLKVIAVQPAVDQLDLPADTKVCAEKVCADDTRQPVSVPEVAAIERACKVCAPTSADCLHQPAEPHPSFSWRSTGQRVTRIHSHRPNQRC